MLRYGNLYVQNYSEEVRERNKEENNSSGIGENKNSIVFKR